MQIVAAAVAAALISLLVCMFALTPKYEASINLIVNTRQDTTSTYKAQKSAMYAQLTAKLYS